MSSFVFNTDRFGIVLDPCSSTWSFVEIVLSVRFGLGSPHRTRSHCPFTVSSNGSVNVDWIFGDSRCLLYIWSEQSFFLYRFSDLHCQPISDKTASNQSWSSWNGLCVCTRGLYLGLRCFVYLICFFAKVSPGHLVLHLSNILSGLLLLLFAFETNPCHALL